MAVQKKVYTGGCLCGAVRFEAEAPAAKPHTCSCKMCQQHSGALTVSWVEFPRSSVTWTKGKPAKWRSSDYSSRAFCKTCGSTLGAIDDAPTVALVLGSFDKAGAKELAPQYHSFKGNRPRWWHVDIKT
jgi:hypothetical protein